MGFFSRYSNVLNVNTLQYLVLGKYLNYAFLIVSPDIWFYIVI